MDLTPGNAVRDSRSLSVGFAQYEAEAGDAEAEIRQLVAKVKAAHAKADQARLQKQQTAAAREDAFQQERDDRQAAVRESITDHHIEGMRKAVKLDRSHHLLKDLKNVAAGDFEIAPNATTFVSAMVLRELIGDHGDFLTTIAGKVLVDPVIVTTNGSQRYDPLPKHQFSPKQLPTSPSPTTKSAQGPFSLPRLSIQVRDDSLDLGIESAKTIDGLHNDHDVDPAEANLLTIEIAADTPETLIESEAQTSGFRSFNTGSHRGRRAPDACKEGQDEGQG